MTDAESLAELQAAFMASPWAARTPVDVEVPFDMVIGGTVVRGRIDAVFADADGGARSSTGRRAIRRTPRRPSATHAVQLAVYRLAWAALRGVPAESVRAAFHYVRVGADRRPGSLPGLRRPGGAAGAARRLGACGRSSAPG